MYKYLEGGYKENKARVFSLVSSDKTKGNGHKQEVSSEYQESLFCYKDD